ncbi:Prohibitin [Cricetulus griseus]|uniref:Prohibitin n=1 Tax=Cricetulus griseus TaxID=10029 RepID=G3IKS8_CRIGR|nr:Prohibitin [Cricetulus griseus]
MAAKGFESIGKFGLTLAFAGGTVNSALYNVDAGHRAVIFDRFRGVQDIVVGEGTHFLIPWVQTPTIFDCGSRPQNVPVITDERVLPSITTEILESLVARFDAGELITQRRVGLQAEPVEAKQMAQQEAERARFVVEKAEQQQKAALISAKGDSKAAELIANSLATAGDGLIELSKLEAAEDIAYQFSRFRNITYQPAGQSVLLQLPQILRQWRKLNLIEKDATTELHQYPGSGSDCDHISKLAACFLAAAWTKAVSTALSLSVSLPLPSWKDWL